MTQRKQISHRGVVFIFGCGLMAAGWCPPAAADLVVSTNQLRHQVQQAQYIASDYLQVWNVNATDAVPYTVAATVAWLRAEPTNGVCSSNLPGSLHVQYDTVEMPAGTNTGLVVLSSPNVTNPPVVVTVELVINPVPVVPRIQPVVLTEQVPVGATTSFTRRVEVWNGGALTGEMRYAMSAYAMDGWLAVAEPTNGVSYGELHDQTVVFTNLAGLAKGTYWGSVTVQDAAGSGSAWASIALEVVPPPAGVGLGTSELQVAVGQGQRPADQAFGIWNAGGGTLGYRLDRSDTWLALAPSGGTSTGEVHQITVSFDTAQLAPGVHNGAVMIFASNRLDELPLTLPVFLAVTQAAAVIAVTPGAATNLVLAGSGSITQNWAVWNSGAGLMAYTLSANQPWLALAPTNGSSSGARQAHAVTINPAGLREGVHTGLVTVTSASAANAPVSVPVVLQVAANLGRSTLLVTNSISQGLNAADRQFSIWNAGSTNPLAYQLACTVDWLRLAVTNGSVAGGTNTITVQFLTTNLSRRIHFGEVWLRPVNPAGPASRVLVRLEVTEPVGYFAEKIVFHSDRDGTYDLWMMDPDGGHVVPLVQKSGAQTLPRISPDGTRLAYQDTSSGQARLIVRDLTTGFEDQYSPLLSYDWSADSRALIGTWPGRLVNSVWQTDLASHASWQLFALSGHVVMFGAQRVAPFDLFYAVDPKWLPNTGLGVYHPAAYTFEILQNPDQRYERDGRLGPAGTLLAYAKAANQTNAPYRIAVFDVSSRRERLLTDPLGPSDYAPAFSPAQDALVFARTYAAADSAIMRIRTNGLAETTLLRDGAFNSAPDWGMLFINTTEEPVLAVSPRSFTNAVEVGDERELESLFEIWNPTNGTLTFDIANDASWCWPSVNSGYSTGQHVTVGLRFNAKTLAAGTYTGRLAITANAANAPQEVTLLLEVTPPPAVLYVAPNSLSADLDVTSTNTSPKYLFVANQGGGSMLYTVRCDRIWMTATPSSGIGTGQYDRVTVSFLPIQPAGVYTGLVVVSGGGTSATIAARLVMSDPRTNAPILAVAPTNLAVTIPYGPWLISEHLEVWNAGGQRLSYRLEIDPPTNWVAVWGDADGSSRGETNRHTLDFNGSFVTQGVYRSTCRVVADNGQSRTVPLRLTKQDPIWCGLVVDTDPHHLYHQGLVTVEPPGPSYPRGTRVTVIAAAAWSNYTFNSWTGAVRSSQRVLTLTMTNEDVIARLYATYYNPTTVDGYLFSQSSGRLLPGATVAYASGTSRWSLVTGADGYYRFFTTRNPGNENLYIQRPGYEPVVFSFTSRQFQNYRTNFNLVPHLFENVQARQVPGARDVEIRYDLLGLANEQFRVGLQISQDNGRTWNVPLETLRGDANRQVRVGSNHVALWHAEEDWPGQQSSTMKVRLTADDFAINSAAFFLDTRTRDNWRLRAWTDNNRDGNFDVGEELAAAEVYYPGRTAADLRGRTSPEGYFTVPQNARQGEGIFIRKSVYTDNRAKDPVRWFGNLALRVWMDSDVTGQAIDQWDGTWRTCTLTAANIAELDRGNPVYVWLSHAIYEWSLVMAVHANDPAAFIAAMTNGGAASVSRFLYQMTDGQMKIGMLSILRQDDEGATDFLQSDVWVRTGSRGGKANIEGIRSSSTNSHIFVGETYGTNNTHNPRPPTHSDWYRTITHEIGHYVLGMYDEYISAIGGASADVANWRNFRRANTNDIPKNYGLMDNHFSAADMSSWNDYLPAYQRPTNNVGGFSNRVWLAFRSNITAQIFEHELRVTATYQPCWDWLDSHFSGYYSNIWASPSTPPYGMFRNGVSTSSDRPGSTNIPAPYTACVVNIDGFAARRNAAGYGDEAPIHLQVYLGQDPAPDAQVMLRPAGVGYIRRLGMTDPAGRYTLASARPGEIVDVVGHGARASHVITAQDALAPVVLQLAPRRMGPQADALGVVVGGSLDSQLNFTLAVQASEPLATDPVVTVYPYNSYGVSVPMSAAGANVYTGVVALAGIWNGSVGITCQAAGGQSWTTLDEFQLDEIDQVMGTFYSADALVTVGISYTGAMDKAVAMIYQGHGPIPSAGGVSASNQVSDLLFVALQEDAYPLGPQPLALNITYWATRLEGRDLNSLRLGLWTNGGWETRSSELDPESQTLSAAQLPLGAYTLFADLTTDTNPPSAITDLQVATGADTHKVDLQWSAPGGDGTNGLASYYEVRCSTAPITPDTWAAAIYFPPGLVPKPFGQPESVSLPMPEPDTVYYFAVRAVDAAGNLAPLSNVSAAPSQVTDSDHDGLPDQWIASVNAIAGQPMGPADDLDGDGLTTLNEYLNRTDPNAWDSDGDGMGDGWELLHGLNPLAAEDAALDSDGDLIANGQEYLYGTDPTDADTDGDQYDDGTEISMGTDPLSYTSSPGRLTVALSPTEAVDAGARWRLTTGLYTNWQVPSSAVLATGSYTLAFQDVSGWSTPTQEVFTIFDGADLSFTGMYLRLMTSLPWLILLGD